MQEIDSWLSSSATCTCCICHFYYSCSQFLDNVVAIWDIRRPFIPFASFSEHTDDVTGESKLYTQYIRDYMVTGAVDWPQLNIEECTSICTYCND